MNYPKPSYNTRVAMHLSANQYSAASGDPCYYLNECKQMGVSWVKGLTDRDAGATDWIPIALEFGLMPVVRIYQPMPWILDDTIKRAIGKLVGMGVHYIETLNEPDNQQEWDPVPADWAYQAANQQVTVARYIQQAGGIPLIAALSTGSPGSYTDMTAKIVQVGGRDIFEKPFVMSIHNYPLNHPIGLKEWGQSDTYPYDDANQEGAPISEEVYRKWGDTNSLAWEGRSRELVNQWRLQDKNPGATLLTDNCGEVNLFYVAEKAKETLGFYPMCIVTEGGVIIGDAQDRRYPKNTGAYMRDANVELARRCMGTSESAYPDWVLAGGGYWLLGNYRMGHTSPNWESQAWYTDTWPQYNSGGRLWVVDAMKAMPKVAYGEASPPVDPPVEPPPEPPPEPDLDWQIPESLPNVKLYPASVLPGERYWKLVKAKWLNVDESQGAHSIRVDVLDKYGEKAKGIHVVFHNGGTVSAPSYIDGKTLNFPMYGTLGSYTVFMGDGVSDKIDGLGLGTPEQPTYSIHTCFELIFQETVYADMDELEEGPDPSDRHCVLVAQRPEAIEWTTIEALRSYLECHRSTITFSHHDAAGLDGGGGYANVSVISTDTMPVSIETIEIVRSAPAVKWLEVISGNLDEIVLELESRIESGMKYGSH